MNRWISIALAAVMALSLSACRNQHTLAGDDFHNGAVGSHGGVSSASEYASQIGLDILEAGGNAIDAAVATAFAVGVVEPQFSGIGGAGLMTIYLADEDRCTTIEYLETVPGDITPGWYDAAADKYTARNAAVPSQVHGLLTALEEYGTMTPAEVLEPVIELARDGYTVNETLASAINTGCERILLSDTAASIYTDGEFPLAEGDTIINEPLADTLQQIADGGIAAFYTGDLAQRIVDDLQANGSLITMEDMANYTSVEREPISTTYHGYEIVTVSAPSNGGEMLLETLNILEKYDLHEMGLNSYEYLLTMGDAMRIGWQDAFTCLGDPAFYDLPIERMISKEYADSRRVCMPVDGTSQYLNELMPAGDLVSTRIDTTAAQESKHTSHISVIDQYGNVVSTTNTLGNTWGSTYMPEGTGFFLNSHMGNMTHDPDQSDDPDFVIGGKRVRSTMAPTIVLQDGAPVMAIGSPGSISIPPAIITVLNNVLLFDMNIQQAINAPRAAVTTLSEPYSVLTIEADRMDPDVITELEEKGYTLNNKGDYSLALGGVAAIYKNPRTGLYEAGADPRREYKALAY